MYFTKEMHKTFRGIEKEIEKILFRNAIFYFAIILS